MEYENRVVFFIDILGFINIVKSTLDSKENCIKENIDEIYEIFDSIRYFLGDNEVDKISQSRQFTQFSDSIVISFLANEKSEIYHTLYYIQLLLVDLVSKKILCRGGVSYGKLLHDDKLIFGPALNDAYDMELKAALFPRIILDESIISLGGIYHARHHLSHHEIGAIHNVVTKDTDNMYYIDYFAKTIGNFSNQNYLNLYIDDLRNIVSNYKNTKDPSLIVKYGWIKNKLDKMIRKVKRKK
jgi:hypothetical protein